MLTRDIHSNKETVMVALYDLKESIMLAKKDKDKLLCLIVGYGSKGKTHKIKTAVIEELNKYIESKFIKGYVFGSDIDIFNPYYQRFPYRDRIPDNDKRMRNPGAIYIAV